MVLCGSINKQIASSITMAGGRAVGLSGKDDGLVRRGATSLACPRARARDPSCPPHE